MQESDSVQTGSLRAETAVYTSYPAREKAVDRFILNLHYR